MLTELKNRSVADVLMVVGDGLTGLLEAITTGARVVRCGEEVVDEFRSDSGNV